MLVRLTRTLAVALTFAVLGSALPLTGAPGEASAAEPRRILLLHSFGRDYSPFAEAGNIFRAKLIEKSKQAIDLYEASIFTARFEQSDEMALVGYLRDLFNKRRIDLIVTLGAPAAYFALEHRAKIGPDIKIVVSGLGDRRVPRSRLTANDTVISTALDLRVLVDNILKLLPDTKNIAVAIGNTPVERFWVEEMRKEYQVYSPRVAFSWLNELPLHEMVDRVKTLPPNSAILYFFLWVDAAGVPYPLDQAFAPLQAAAKVPFFSYGDYNLGNGTIGGPVAPSNAAGEKTAEVVVRILNGETPENIKSPPNTLSEPTYDWRELRRWNISEAALPPGSIVRFREPTVLERYWWQIALAAAVLAVQTLLISALLYQRRKRAVAEIEVRQRAADLALLNRRAVAGQLTASIAHEINQPLAAIVANGSAGLRWLSSKTPNVDEVSASLRRIIDDGHRASQVVENVRAMFKKDVQKKTAVDINELIDQVLDLTRSELDRHNVSVARVHARGQSLVLVDRVQLQQVFINLIRNAHDAMDAVKETARILTIRNAITETGQVLISFEDTGPGIDADMLGKIFEPFFTTKPNGMGIGLAICRSIVEAHGGTLSASRSPRGGTMFEVELPAARTSPTSREQTDRAAHTV